MLLFHRYLNYIPLPFLSMTQVKFYKTFHSQYENVMVFVVKILLSRGLIYCLRFKFIV